MPSGIDALDAVKASHYDLILMDCRMPGMDGFETTSKIRQLGFILPIVALTASTTAAERELCFESGMDDILTKPYTSTELSHVLSKWLLDK
jgi:CheY-like chemotaxis protein